MPKTSKEKHTPDSLLIVSEQLLNCGAALRGIAESMQRAGIKTMEVEGQAEMVRGVKGIETFRHKAQRAFQSKIGFG